MNAKKVVVVFKISILVTHMACRTGMPLKEARLSRTSFEPCQPNLNMRLRGGKDTGIPEVEDEKYAQREAVWQKWREEWEYCTGASKLECTKSQSQNTVVDFLL